MVADQRRRPNNRQLSPSKVSILALGAGIDKEARRHVLDREPGADGSIVRGWQPACRRAVVARPLHEARSEAVRSMARLLSASFRLRPAGERTGLSQAASGLSDATESPDLLTWSICPPTWSLHAPCDAGDSDRDCDRHERSHGPMPRHRAAATRSFAPPTAGGCSGAGGTARGEAARICGTRRLRGSGRGGYDALRECRLRRSRRPGHPLLSPGRLFPLGAKLMLVTSACASKPQPIPAVPTSRTCPPPAKPPASLMQEPAVKEFLPS